jgi:hypothetical protein
MSLCILTNNGVDSIMLTLFESDSSRIYSHSRVDVKKLEKKIEDCKQNKLHFCMLH